MERVAEQERELRRLSNLMAEHQAILRTLPERPQPQSPPTSPSHNLARLRDEVHDVLPGTVNIVRGAVDRVGQVPDLGDPPTFKEDTLNDILEEQQDEEEVPVTPERWAQILKHQPAHCKTRGVTKVEDTTLQSVPGALYREKPSKIPRGPRSV